MNDYPTTFSKAWSKLAHDPVTGEIRASLGLTEHSADVAATARALMALPSILRRLEMLAQRALRPVDLERLAVLAFLHDIGKASVGFQSKRLMDEERASFLKRKGIRTDQCGHTRVVAGLLHNPSNRRRIQQRWPLEEIEHWQGGENSLFWASVSHHGTPLTQMNSVIEATSPWNAIWNSSPDYDPADAIALLGDAARHWYPQAFVSDAEALPATPEFTHAFAGLVSLADWIASNPDSRFFPFDGHGDGCRMAFARARARNVLRNMRIDLEDARADIAQRQPLFESIFPFAPSALQKEAADTNLGNLVVAEDETGAGKTEAALWRFKTLFEAGEVDSLAFVLPTRVAAVAIDKRVEEFIGKVFPDSRLRPNVLLAAPGYLRVDGDEGRRDLLARFKFLWPDKDAETDAHRCWVAENSKRYLAAAVAVGTIDQVLLSGLTTRHAHLRGFALLRSLLVVDEVHASDAYMTAILSGVLRRHLQAGGHAMLLSATLGSDARERFFDRHRRRSRALRAGQRRAVEPAPPDPIAVPYPCVSDASGTRLIASRGRERHVEIELARIINDANAIARRAADAVLGDARVLIVRNTVNGAIAVQSAIEAMLGADHAALFRAEEIVCPHHGRFAAEDRRLLDEAVEQSFGKAAPPKRAVVLVGTQTLEQSLDIDADLLITDLAPCDILLQRIGRLHRHAARERPPSFESPRAVILTPAERDLSPFLKRRGGSRHGIGSVYDNMLSVEATWAELDRRGTLHIPADNRGLVEATTRSESLRALGESLGGDWPRHWIEYQGSIAALLTAGQTHALDWSVAWDDQTWAEPNGERLRTRLGLDDRLAEFEHPVSSPFGQTLRGIKIPGWMARGVSADADSQAEVVDESSEGLTFRWQMRGFRYSRFGLEGVG